MDDATSIEQLKDLVEDFVTKREWAQFHSPKNLSMAITIEASELMNLFRWHTTMESMQVMKRKTERSQAIDEIADIIILVLAFANRNAIDVSQAVEEKLHKNDGKYPIEQFKGRF